jgi:hypothetical protein
MIFVLTGRTCRGCFSRRAETGIFVSRILHGRMSYGMEIAPQHVQ